MAPAAVAFFRDPSRELDVAAVTGTAGKTTTTYLLFEILRAAGRRPGLLTNLERRVGDDVRPAALNTPEAIDLQRLLREMVDAGNTACAMEATSHASVQGRLDGVRFAVLVFTNLAHEHLDFHGTMEEYFAAKRRLFAQAERAVVNVGDPWGRRLAAELDDPIVFDADRDALDANLKLRGRFNFENALGAAAAARALGIGEDAIRDGIEAVDGVPGRLEFVDEGQPFAVIVDYAHKPASLERVLHEARRLSEGRVICVFGCGGDRDREKRPLMGRIAHELADVAIVTSDNPRSEDPLAIIDEIARRRARARGRARPARGDRKGDRVRPRRRRRADRGQGPRAGAGDRGREASLRRSRGRARRVARAAARVIPLRLDMLRDLVPGQWERAVWASEVTGVQVDSRRIEEGDLFVAVGDGAAYTKHAFARGAAATLVPDEPVRGARRDRGRGARPQQRALRRDHRLDGEDVDEGHPRRDLRRSRRGRSRRSRASTTRSACRSRFAGSSPTPRSASSSWRCAGSARSPSSASSLGPHIGVITNIAPVHLEKVGDARRRRAREERADRCAAARRHGDRSRRLSRRPRRHRRRPRRRGRDARVVRAAASAHVDRHRRRSTSARSTSRRTRSSRSPRRARSASTSPSGSTSPFAEWRNQELPLPGGGLLVNDAWNANPLSMRAALEHLRVLAAGRRRVAVLGEMAELGSYSDEAHDEVARSIAEIGVDVLISVGERARVYGGSYAADADEALTLVRAELEPGDCVLVKGARALGLERVADALAGVTA